MFLMKANKKHQNPIKDWGTHFLSLFPKVYFRIPKPWALQTALQRLNSANILDTHWANIRRGSMPVYTAPSYLVSIGHESFTAGQWDLQCSRNPTRVWKRPHGVLKHLHEEWGGGVRREQLPATITVCTHNLFGRVHTLHEFQNLKSLTQSFYTMLISYSQLFLGHSCTQNTRALKDEVHTISQSLGYLPSPRSIVTGIRRLKSCIAHQPLATHANDDPSTLYRILMD